MDENRSKCGDKRNLMYQIICLDKEHCCYISDYRYVLYKTSHKYEFIPIDMHTKKKIAAEFKFGMSSEYAKKKISFISVLACFACYSGQFLQRNL